ncbi:MAG TPA: hypothetical protein VFM93_09755 [Candidatus Limnocylindria bacterium]|nr:hypothetical protein [Candidatus Limnocylindria bacterium]
MIRRFAVFAIAALLAAVLVPETARANDDPQFVYQEGTLPRLDQAQRFILRGALLDGICQYRYNVQVPSSWQSYQVRDVGIDSTRCVKLVEYGIPTQPPPRGDRMLSKDIEPSTRSATGKTGVPARLASTVSSGYSKAWYENSFQALLTGDTTYLTWEWDGSCVLTGSVRGGWEWNSNLGWGIQSYGGDSDLTCARQYGNTYSYFTGLLGCYHQYYYVKGWGWWDGLITGDRSATANCGGAYFHYSVVKTTG